MSGELGAVQLWLRISVLSTSSIMPNKKSSKKARKTEGASVSGGAEPGTATNAEPLLSPELQAELGGADTEGGDISTSIVLPATGKVASDTCFRTCQTMLCKWELSSV
jgi:hypothetical protein